MTSFSRFARFTLVLAVVVAGCTSSGAPPATTTPRPVPPPTPVPTTPPPAATPPATPPAAPTPAEAPNNWQLLDAVADGVAGISALRAERELLAGRTPARTVIVAVIDGGVDTTHADLRANLWTNPRETPGNARDDDNNGFVDDTFGWNFIGGRDGENVHWDTLELTRLHVRCTTIPDSLPADERAACPAIATAFDEKRAELEQQRAQIRMIDGMFSRISSILRGVLAGDSLSAERVRALVPASDSVRQARELYLRMEATGISASAIADAREDLEGRLEYGLNPEFDPRPTVGDDPRNPNERRYGNRDVMGPDAKHGTHVSGIIGAVRGNAVGIDGVAPAVRLMTIRTVPNGDERDKDVANAIRYAVDNGAQIINMSFGKEYSPHKRLVDEAVKYADGKGVLMIHAAGNDGADLAVTPSYPTAQYLDGGRAANWIEVSASSWQGKDSLAAPFSNYGQAQVDVFAPGVDIYSTVPGGGYERQSGTSMAAPVVSGLAAMLMSYFPNLTAADVRRLILETATRYSDVMVVKPGTQDEKVRFGALSVTGGVVNAHAAIRAALATVQ